jgi:hypothetical protein
MKMAKPPIHFTPLTIVCEGDGACGAVMEDVNLADMTKYYHPATGDQRDYSQACTEIYINCMGCNRKIRISGLHSYHESKIALQNPPARDPWDR